MITTPTFLILGALASCPYGFPTARQLKWIICDAFVNVNTTASRFLGHKSDYSPSEFYDFAQALRQSGQASVDAFLEHRAKTFIDVGKLAIAYCLIPFEDERKLFRPELDQGAIGMSIFWGNSMHPSRSLVKNSCRLSPLIMIGLLSIIS